MEPFIGQIQAFGFNFAPRGWAKCDGQLLSISQNSALFSLLGVMYGGDGRTTFGLPDLRSRSLVGAGHGPGLDAITQGATGGRTNITLRSAELPSHSHTATLKVSSANSTQETATAGVSIAAPGTTAGRTFTATQGFNTTAPNTTLNASSVTNSNTGGNGSFNNRNPYLGINYCIAIEGLYPSRS